MSLTSHPSTVAAAGTNPLTFCAMIGVDPLRKTVTYGSSPHNLERHGLRSQRSPIPADDSGKPRHRWNGFRNEHDTRKDPGRWHQRMLTARAAKMASTVNEMMDWSII